MKDWSVINAPNLYPFLFEDSCALSELFQDLDFQLDGFVKIASGVFGRIGTSCGAELQAGGSELIVFLLDNAG